MAGFSASNAIGTGFRLIARHPLAVLAWALAYVVLGVLPQLAVMGTVLPDMFGFYRDALRNAPEAGESFDMGRMLALQGRMMMLQPLMLISQLVMHAVLLGAIYRAVLTPQDSRFGYLRLSRRELWLGLTLAVFVVALMLMMFVVMIPLVVGGVLTAVAAERGGGGAGASGLVIGLLAIAACVAILWVALRLSLALPMSYDQSRFVLYESWALTRGHALKMFLVALALVVIVWLIEALLGGVVAGALIGYVAQGGGFAALADKGPGELIRMFGPWLVVLGPLLAILAACLYAIWAAPLAEIYRELTGGAEPAPPAATAAAVA
jgi:hypothetical protein